MGKLAKHIPEHFMDTVASLSPEDLKERVIVAETRIKEIEHAKDEDIELARLKEDVKELAQPYKEAVKIERAKIEYILEVLEGRGKL